MANALLVHVFQTFKNLLDDSKQKKAEYLIVHHIMCGAIKLELIGRFCQSSLSMLASVAYAILPCNFNFSDVFFGCDDIQ